MMRIFPRNFAPLAIGILFIFFTTFASAATRLPPDEVEALREIGKTLGKTDWDFSADPCTFLPEKQDDFENAVNCTCNDTVCHITRIALKAQDLPGTLPPELTRLTYLEDIDLNRNYINGTIPPEWGSMMKLEKINLLGNRLTGPIPKELANIKTITTINLEFNQLSGPIPLELGSLPLLERLRLTSNYFTGKLPEELAKLTTLKDFRIGDNHFTGKIPDFIKNWVNLNKLVIQGSGLDGPIPLGIGLLTNLSDLRISDLNGSQASFPPLNNLTSLKTLILRSCNIIGPLPQYLGTMTNLEILLDLSFNNLSGDIPSTFASLSSTYNMYLTGNLLSGPVPHWMLETSKYIDLSYNNFSFGTSQDCQQRNKNLFGSSSKGNLSGNVSCLSLRSFHCERNWSSFYINCGGKEVSLGGNMTYEYDGDPAGPSKFYQSKTNWAFSSTGNFLDNDYNRDSVISSLLPTISVKETPLYVDARISPISLTYYGFCLVNGSYTVNLHFAEIMFNDGRAYSSLGRRIFDIYIQGKLEQKDFNIADEAGGIGQAIIKNYIAVVTHGTLEIRLYWAGKGTTGIPTRGVYGPLISAISVNKLDNKSSTLRPTIVMVVVPVSIALVLTALTCVLLRLRKRKDVRRKGRTTLQLFDERGADADLPLFDLITIVTATDNFSLANKLGQGGFGPVYKGRLLDGQEIAVKRLAKNSGQGVEEFKNEVSLIAKLQHRNLVRLLGCCIQEEEKILIYEYLPNKSLDSFIFGSLLDWRKRFDIVLGIARGMLYLHQDSRLRVIHRGLKASNVLLDAEMNPKISDFGMARICGGDQIEANTNRVVGTYGYMSPEYAMQGLFSIKSDVFSFGVLLLEIVSGTKNSSYYQDNCMTLIGHAWDLWREGKALDIVHPFLRDQDSFPAPQVLRCIQIGLLCVQDFATDRPTMSKVAVMLCNETALLSPKQPAFIMNGVRKGPDSSSTSGGAASSVNDVTLSTIDGR